MLETVAHFAQATTPAIPSKTTSARVRSTFLFGGPDDGSAGDGPLSVWLSVLPRTSSPLTASPFVLLFISELPDFLELPETSVRSWFEQPNPKSLRPTTALRWCSFERTPAAAGDSASDAARCRAGAR